MTEGFKWDDIWWIQEVCYGETFHKGLTLSENRCAFRECTFRDATANGHFILVNTQSLNCSFVSCIFIHLSTSSSYYVLYIQEVIDGIINRCCFFDQNALHIYGTGVSTNWCIPYASTNSTVCTKSTSNSPFCGGSIKLSHFFNNNTHLTGRFIGSIYHMHNPPNRDDINCFCNGVFCSGVYTVELSSDVTGCILSQYNIINNSDSNGYFLLYYSNIQTWLREIVMTFNSNCKSRRLTYSRMSGSKVYLENSFILADQDVPEDTLLIRNDVKITLSAITFTPFKHHPKYTLCANFSYKFTHPLYIHSCFVFINFILCSFYA